MDLFDRAFIEFWKYLNKNDVKYILVGGFAINFHGYQRFTGDLDLYIDDTLENRRRFRKAYADYGMGDFQSIETIQFIPGWVDFPLTNAVKLDIHRYSASNYGCGASRSIAANAVETDPDYTCIFE